MKKTPRTGFTIVEIAVVISVIGVLAAIGIALYSGTQQRADDARALATLTQATDALEIHYIKAHDYPPNLAGTKYAGPEEVALALFTNAPTTRQYVNLTPAQNAQLLLNACNANMPVISGSTTYNTGCRFAGNNFHIKGKRGSNVLLHGPTVTEAEFQLSCGTVCDNVRNTIVSEFIAQNGSFPIQVPRRNVSLPQATLQATGNATQYCLESRSVTREAIVYHTTHEDNDVRSGPCPEDPELHYLPG